MWSLLLILGMISVNLAVVNFLPIPVLDGGHMVFLIYELVRRKPPSDAVRRRRQLRWPGVARHAHVICRLSGRQPLDLGRGPVIRPMKRIP